MKNDEQVIAHYQFSSAVDVLATFERLRIELTGQLDTAQTVEVEVFDISPDLDANTDPVSLIEHLIDEIPGILLYQYRRL